MPAQCQFCSGEIRFRTIKGIVVPIHDWAYSCPTGQRQGQPDECRRTKCPVCGDEVYFVRHNGGSVWFDELGKPWEKHSCFAEQQPSAASLPKDFEQVFLVRVRHVIPLAKDSGYLVACGRDRRRSDLVDILTDKPVVALDRQVEAQLQGKWIYIDWTRRQLITVQGRRYSFRGHEAIGGWKIL